MPEEKDLQRSVPNELAASTQELADALNEPERRKKWPWLVGALVVILLGVSAGGAAYASHYADRALPGTSVAGIDVSGKTKEQIADTITKKADEVTVTINGDVSATPTLSDLGAHVDADATATSALSINSSIWNRFTALFSKRDIPTSFTIDEQKFTTYLDDLIPADVQQSKNATVVLDDEGTAFTITPSVTGKSLNDATVSKALEEATQTLKSQSITLDYIDAPPRVSDEQAQEVANQANARIHQDVVLSKPDSDMHFSPDAEVKASWLTITNQGGNTQNADNTALPTVTVDEAKVAQWVTAQAEEAKTEPITGQRRVLQNGTVVATPVEAEDGAEVNNANEIAQALTQALNDNKPYEATFTMTPITAEWKEKVIADGAQNLAYPAAPGEKWIDINLTAKTITAYEGATVVRGPEAMVDGSAEHPTVTGLFSVYLKYESQTMRGEDYETPGVPWISYFHLGYAIHGAPWRSSFGYSGSHGCVNLPVDSAHWYYNWDEIGTPVMVHY
ncbi:L,D-transpeptidase family protein [Actinomyces vulturis]|uniref:L,D-transpeptidase family protein n=1 Tax=Actinomyces vulturis TaxID=1857645 RepID=UPI000A6CEB80|nr:L,D-transpeptidase family protein [Actinomyces vulturis]